jgi:hypothetical protein
MFSMPMAQRKDNRRARRHPRFFTKLSARARVYELPGVAPSAVTGVTLTPTWSV